METIKSFRKLYNLTQEDLAELLSVSLTAVISWESGRNKPRAIYLRLIGLFKKRPELMNEF